MFSNTSIIFHEKPYWSNDTFSRLQLFEKASILSLKEHAVRALSITTSGNPLFWYSSFHSTRKLKKHHDPLEEPLLSDSNIVILHSETSAFSFTYIVEATITCSDVASLWSHQLVIDSLSFILFFVVRLAKSSFVTL